jgi:predicted DNA binding protein
MDKHIFKKIKKYNKLADTGKRLVIFLQLLSESENSTIDTIEIQNKFIKRGAVMVVIVW